MDIESILEKAVENPHNQNITTLTYTSILQKKRDVIKGLKSKDTAGFLKKLEHYRFVDELPEIRTGCYIRWIPLEPPLRLTNGGIVMSIDIKEKGIYITCKNNMNRFFRIQLDHCLVFQKITAQEHVILSVLDHIHKK